MTHPVARKMTKAEREGAKILIDPSAPEQTDFVFPKNRVAAAMIMGDSYAHKEVKRAVDSLKGAGISKLFLAYNGRSRRTIQWLFNHLKKIDLPFVVQKFKWEDDFSKARNQSFEMVPKDEFDWIIWIDTDDQLVLEKPLDELFDSLDPYTQGVYLRYDYAVDEKTEAVTVQQWRERILSTKVDWTWKYAIHEVATCPIGTQFAKRDGAYIRHYKDTKGAQENRERNRRIITKALKDDPDDPRLQFYFANEFVAEADSMPPGQERDRVCDAGVLAFKRFIENPNATPDNLYIALNRAGELLLWRRDYDRAIDSFMQGFKIYPDWPDSYIGVAQAAMESQDWGRAKTFATIALERPMPITSSLTTPVSFTYTPLFIRGISNENMGLYEQAIEDYEAALNVWTPPHTMLQDKINELKEKLAVTPKDKDERKLLRGKRPEKSIAFVTAPLAEPWHPELEKKGGAGGAETCIMRLAPRFAADGWRTVVFGTPGQEYRGIDEYGVEWWNAEEFIPNEKFKVVIASRIPDIFGANLASDIKILWMHDVNVAGRMYSMVNFPDAIVGLTNWHADHMSRLYGIDRDKFSVVPNGIELDLFDLSKRTDDDSELRMIWSSSPDRGLGTLISLWPTIRSWYPTARLDVFYGWNIIDKIIEVGGDRSTYLHKMKSELLGNIARIGGEDVGIHQYGRISQADLSEWQLKAHVWPYPTDFMETFCITAIEMQAAGVIPVTSNLAALKETVACPELRVEGWPLNRDYQNRWLRTLESVVEAHPEKQIDLQRRGRSLAESFTWDNAYEKWNDLFRRLNG